MWSKIFLLITIIMTVPTVEARLPRVSKNEVANNVGCNGSKKEVCKRIVKRHLIRDIKNCQIEPELLHRTPEILSLHNSFQGKVIGSNSYLGFFPGIYSYSWSLSKEAGLMIKANVHFTNTNKLDQTILDQMQMKLDQASAIWTKYNPYPYPVKFQFKLHSKGEHKDVRAHLLVDKPTRGPYFLFWTNLWSANTVAHEMGHVLGLDDEYSNTPWPQLTYCDRNSLMCTSHKSVPQPYHYYLILRRLMCRL